MTEPNSLHYSLFFHASPERIYRILTNADLHSELIGAVAKIKPEIGSKFEMWDGAIEGQILDLLPDSKIVLSWRSDEDGWMEDKYSTITIVLSAQEGGTQMEFEQVGIPEKFLQSVNNGWQNYYFEPLHQMLEYENKDEE